MFTPRKPWSAFLALAAYALGGVPAPLAEGVQGTVRAGGSSTPRGSAISSQSPRVHRVSSHRDCLRLAAGGVITRNATPAPAPTGGVIELPFGPTRQNVRWAGLYWVVLDDAPAIHANAVTFNGIPVAPELIGVTESPCWAESHAYAYFADVTGLVVSGANVVGGLDDSGRRGVAPETEGASLLAIYESGTFAACEIIVFDGNDVLDAPGTSWDVSLPVTCGAEVPANLWFVGADGQPAVDSQEFNGAKLDPGQGFRAEDPVASGAWPAGWDTDMYRVVTGAPNVATVSLPSSGHGDCVNWVATAIEVGVGGCRPVSVESESWGRTKARYRAGEAR